MSVDALVVRLTCCVMLSYGQLEEGPVHAAGSTTSKSGCVTHLVTQCAAVRTHCVPMRAPPHRYWFSELMSATCQHHSAGSPSSPPTTRPCLSRLRTVPFTPHTYLLYTGGRVVVEPPAGGPENQCYCYKSLSVFYIKNWVLWDVMQCGSCKNRRFGGTWLLHNQGDKNRWTRNVSHN
jgi:hypothetical protein